MARTKRPGGRTQTVIPPGRIQSVALILFAALALWASFQLLQSEMKILSDPTASLACDLNPLIACSSSLLSPQAHLFFGISNSVIGIGFFSALLTLAVLGAAGVRFPTWIWWGMAFGSVAGLAYVAFFLWKSLTFFKALCPYCMLIWVGVIGAAIIIWGVLLNSGKAGRVLIPAGKNLSRYWLLVSLLVYLLIILLIVIVLRQQVASLFA